MSRLVAVFLLSAIVATCFAYPYEESPGEVEELLQKADHDDPDAVNDEKETQVMEEAEAYSDPTELMQHGAWGYAKEGADWGEVTGNQICDTGKTQSPINIATFGPTGNGLPQCSAARTSNPNGFLAWANAGKGACRDATGKYPPWGAGTFTNAQAKARCAAQANCLGYMATNPTAAAAGYSQFYCATRTGICTFAGNGATTVTKASMGGQGANTGRRCFLKKNWNTKFCGDAITFNYGPTPATIKNSGHNVQITFKTGFELIRSNAECKSSDVNLGTATSAQDCANKMKARFPTAQFFIFGKGGKAGRCYKENTSTAACTEGWEPDQYDFYQVARENSFSVCGETFPLVQLHFHAQSENQFDGENTAMEMHLVHKNPSYADPFAVIGVMLSTAVPPAQQNAQTVSGVNNLFGSTGAGGTCRNGPKVNGEATNGNCPATALPAKINPMDFLPTDKSYFRFQGSFTTPPCTQGVRWFELRTKGAISALTADRFKAAMEFAAVQNAPAGANHNNRVVQNLFNRPICVGGAASTRL